MTEALPTRNAEDWRYADLAALAPLWPLADAEVVTVTAGGDYARTIVQSDGGVTRLTLVLESKAVAALVRGSFGDSDA